MGVLGFSAGAHIAAVLTNHFTQRNYPPVDAADRRSCRPDFALVVYPGYLAIAGDSTRVRPEVQPTLRTPPTFIAQAEDDPVGVWNARAYHRALLVAGVPSELHVYPRGGHGYGVRAALNEAAAAWPTAALHWLAKIGVVPRPEARAVVPRTRRRG